MLDGPHKLDYTCVEDFVHPLYSMEPFKFFSLRPVQNCLDGKEYINHGATDKCFIKCCADKLWNIWDP